MVEEFDSGGDETKTGVLVGCDDGLDWMEKGRASQEKAKAKEQRGEREQLADLDQITGVVNRPQRLSFIVPDVKVSRREGGLETEVLTANETNTERKKERKQNDGSAGERRRVCFCLPSLPPSFRSFLLLPFFLPSSQPAFEMMRGSPNSHSSIQLSLSSVHKHVRLLLER